ncbi:uncharacterized protein LOC108162052 isoform X3 [Drosophila miranda]|uniref:uncharacterized protein LOC108162052 isoform X3 n=1 Tax=Drosophila miranda TaxID=7229 RepID=UPI00143F62F0|nr:uncharacterized protein LOC108162052 isoform X3 [Drosophila miranda]
MAEKVEHSQANLNSQQNDARKVRKSPDFQPMMPGVISRERSFVRTSNQQNINKRRSLAFNVPGNQQSGQMRGKPAMDIYRPPNVRGEMAAPIGGGGGGGGAGSGGVNKLNVNAQEFTMTGNCSPTEALSNRAKLQSTTFFQFVANLPHQRPRPEPLFGPVRECECEREQTAGGSLAGQHARRNEGQPPSLHFGDASNQSSSGWSNASHELPLQWQYTPYNESGKVCPGAQGPADVFGIPKPVPAELWTAISAEPQWLYRSVYERQCPATLQVPVFG